MAVKGKRILDPADADPVPLANAAANLRLSAWFQRIFPTYTIFEHTRKMCDAFEAVERGDIQNLMVCVPPRAGKSETLTVAGASWFLGRNPDLEVMIGSYGASLAEKFSRMAREALRYHGKSVFGVELSEDSKSVETWGLKGHRGRFQALGMEGGATGKGGSLLLLDDLVKDYEAAMSELQREAAWNWYDTTWCTRASRIPRARKIIVCTRWHEDDVAGRVLAQEKKGGEKWHKLFLAAVDDRAPYTLEDGPLLCETMWTREDCRLLWTQKSRLFESQYQQRPSTPGGNVIKWDWVKRYDARPRHFSEVIQSWDCAFKDTDGSDFVVGQVWGRIGADRYLLDRVSGHWGFEETCRRVKELRKKWQQARKILVEDKANGTAVVQVLRKELSGVLAVKPEGGKESRVHAVAPEFESGNVYVPEVRHAPWVEEVLTQWATFPSAPHDDDVDAMSQALLYLHGKNGSDWSGLGPAPVLSPREQREKDAKEAAEAHQRQNDQDDRPAGFARCM